MFNTKFNYTDNIVADLGKIERNRTILDMRKIPLSIEIQLRE